MLAYHNVKWSSLSKIFRQIVQLLTLLILANLLSPEDFGIIGMASVVIGFLNVFRDLGISAALIQKIEITNELFSSVFWVNTIFGIIIVGLLILLAPFISHLYNEPRLTPVISVLSINFFVNSLSILHQSLLEKKLSFKRLSIIEIIAILLGSTVAILFAYLDYGVWSLVIQSLVSTVVLSSLLWVYTPRYPSFLFSFKEISSVMKFSLNYSGFNLTNYIVRNSDYFLIGKYLGATELGYYTLAYKFLLFPLQNIVAVINRVMYPILTKFQNNTKNLASKYIYLVKNISFLSFPFLIWLFLTINEITLLFLGEKWIQIIPIVYIFVPLGFIQSIYTPAGLIFQIKSKTDIWFRWGLLSMFLTILAFAIGLQWGIVGVAMSYLIINIILFYPGTRIPLKFIDLSLSFFLKSIFKISVISFFTLITVLLVKKLLLFFNADDVIVFVFSSILVLIIYIILNFKYNPEIIRKILALVREKN